MALVAGPVGRLRLQVVPYVSLYNRRTFAVVDELEGSQGAASTLNETQRGGRGEIRRKKESMS